MTATVTLLREPIERRIAELRAEAQTEFKIADALEAHAEDRRRYASKVLYQADQLTKQLEARS